MLIEGRRGHLATKFQGSDLTGGSGQRLVGFTNIKITEKFKFIPYPYLCPDPKS